MFQKHVVRHEFKLITLAYKIKGMYTTAKTVTPKSLTEIYRMNLFLSALIACIAAFFLIIFNKPAQLVTAMTLKSGCYLLIVTFSQSYILKVTAKRFTNNTARFRMWRYLFSYSSAIGLQLMIWPFFAWMGGIKWYYTDINTLVTFISEALILTTLIMLLQDFALIRIAKSEAILENSLLQVRTAQAESLLLKQQVHPHFLFNSLNTLKALYKKDPLMGEEYLIRLAGFMRAAVSQNDSIASTLNDEIAHCKNYLEMQKIRFGEALEWDITVDDKYLLQGMLPSFSLQPLAENAIKHNRFTKEHPLRLHIRQQDDYICVSNNMDVRPAAEPSLNSGLANLAERCLLWSGEELLIGNNGKEFSVKIKISL